MGNFKRQGTFPPRVFVHTVGRMRVLCVVFLFLPVCLSLVINSTIREKEGISYSDNIKIAQWQVSFDEPDCPMTCDYSDKSTCGTARPSLGLSGCSPTCDPSFCDDVYEWQTIKVGEWTRISQTTTRAPLRAFVTEVTGYRVLVKQIVGDVDISIRVSSPFATGQPSFRSDVGDADNKYWTGYDRTPRESAEICPDDPGFKLGTFFIQMSCFEPMLCLYDIILEPMPAPTGPKGGLGGCNGKPLPAGHSGCLEDGIAYKDGDLPISKVPGDESFYVYYPPKVCIPGVDSVLLGITVGRPYWSFYVIGISGQPFPYTDFTPPALRPAAQRSRPVPSWATPGIQSSNFVSFSVRCQDMPDVLYFSVLTLLHVDPDFKLGPKLTIQSRPQYFTPLRINDLPEWSFPWFVTDALWLKCPNGVEYHPCITGRYVTVLSGGGDKCNQNMNFIKYTDNTNVLWPPFPIQDFQRLVLPILDAPTSQAKDNGLVVLFLMELGNGASSTTYDTFENLAKCTLEFTGALINDNYGSFIGSVPATTVDPSCELNSFVKQKDYMEGILDLLAEATDVIQLLRLQLDIDAASMDNVLVDCYADIDTTILRPVERVQPTLIYGCVDPDNITNPCCDSYLRDVECCAPEIMDVNRTFLDINNNPSLLENLGCLDQECALSFASELSILRNPLRCSRPTETITEFTRKNTGFWTNCIYEVFGRDNVDEALLCNSDADCEVGTCNLFYHQCSVTNIDTLNVYNRKFLKCLLSSDIPPFILAQLVDDPGVRNSEGSGRLTMLVDYMVEKYTTQLCGSINHLDYNMFNTYDLFQVCKDAECQTGDDAPSTLYLFTGERFPAKCALSNECRQEFTHFKLAPVKSCDPEKNQRCNIMGLTNDECTAAPASCVVCEDPLSCKVVPGLTTRAECEGAQVCVDHLGNLHLGVSEAECRALYGACYYNDETKFPVLDPLATGFTEAQCTGQVCETDYHFADPKLHADSEGLCYIFLNQYIDTKSCYFVPASTSNWSTLHNAVCLAWTYTTKSACENAVEAVNKRPTHWIPNGGNGCTDNLEVCRVDFFSPLWAGGDKWTSGKNTTDCNECNGDPAPYFREFSRFWRPGSIRTATWRTPSLLPYADEIPALDYITIGTDVADAIQTYYQFQERTSATCRLSAPASVFENLLCQCDTFYDSNASCENADTTVPSGVSLVCSGFENTLTSLPAVFTFYNNSVSIDGECVSVEARYRSLLFYHTDEVPPLSSVFWFDPRTEDTLVAKNTHNAVVGVLGSSGTKIITKSESGATLVDVKLCIEEEREEELDPQFPAPDIGISYGLDGDVIPQGLSIFREGMKYCAFIDQLEDVTYFLVFRVDYEGWETEEVGYLERGEQIYIAIMGCIYALVWMWSLVSIWWNWNKVLWMMYISLSIFMAWRAVHLLVIAGSDATIQSPALSEPPIFFYFSTVSVLAVMYHVIRTNQDISQHRPAMLRLNVIINAILIAVLLVVIFVSEFVEDSTARETSCFGRVDQGVPDWPAQRIIALVYLCVLCIMSIVFGLAILISGYLLQDELNKGAKNKVSKEEKTSNKYFRLALLLSLSVMCLASQLLLFGNVVATRTIVYLRLTLLWIFELPSPIALLAYSTRQVRNNTSSDTANSHRSSHKGTKTRG